MYGTRRDWESQKSDQKVRRLLEDSIPGDRAGLSPEIQGMNVSIVHNEGMFLLLRANETVQLRKRRNNVAASLSARQLAVFSCSLHTTDQHLTGPVSWLTQSSKAHPCPLGTRIASRELRSPYYCVASPPVPVSAGPLLTDWGNCW